MQRFSLLRYFNAVRSKVQGTVKVRKFKKARNLSSTLASFFATQVRIQRAVDAARKEEELHFKSLLAHRVREADERAAERIADACVFSNFFLTYG